MNHYLLNVMQKLPANTMIRVLRNTEIDDRSQTIDRLSRIMEPGPSFDAIGGWIDAGIMLLSTTTFGQDRWGVSWRYYVESEIRDCAGLVGYEHKEIDLSLLWMVEEAPAGALLHRVTTEAPECRMFANSVQANVRINLGKAFTVLT